jgi:hypothetical protein
MPIIDYILGMLGTGLVFAGPLPWCVLLVSILGDKHKNAGIAHHLLISLSVWCIFQVAVGLLLGILHLLTLPALVLVEAVSLVTGVITLLYLERKNPWLYPGNLPKLPTGWSNLEKLILGIIAITGLVLLWGIMTCPITDYDSLAYHLPTMAQWYQTGTFPLLEQFHQISRYPYNWEVLCTLFLYPLGGNDLLVALPNLIAWADVGSVRISFKPGHGGKADIQPDSRGIGINPAPHPGECQYFTCGPSPGSVFYGRLIFRGIIHSNRICLLYFFIPGRPGNAGRNKNLRAHLTGCCWDSSW